jgi:uncharacterized membrane protein YebE (DUF533 family)
MKDRITAVADLLIGAAHADRRLEGIEKATVFQLLTEILKSRNLPAELSNRIDQFSPGSFSIAKAAAAFARDTPEQKRKLMLLVSAVHESDQEYDLDEDEYLRALGKALGLPEESYRDLVLDIEEIDLAESLEEIRFVVE